MGELIVRQPSQDEVSGLKSEVKNLEDQLNSLANEKIELEKLLSDFQHKHSQELGQLILDILELRKLKYKEDAAKYEEAEADYKSYSKQFETEKARKLIELSYEESSDLKRKFRKASFKCHPDVVRDEHKEAANKVFNDLKTAYEENNLTAVSAILEDLEKGNYFQSISEMDLEIDVLKATIAKLKLQIKYIESEIKSIKESDTYKTIVSITDWDSYFELQKLKLSKELEYLQAKFGTKSKA